MFVDHPDHLVGICRLGYPRGRQSVAGRAHSTLPVVDLDTVVDALSDLRAKSLLRFHDGRFSLYESIREYASEQLGLVH